MCVAYHILDGLVNYPILGQQGIEVLNQYGTKERISFTMVTTTLLIPYVSGFFIFIFFIPSTTLNITSFVSLIHSQSLTWTAFLNYSTLVNIRMWNIAQCKFYNDSGSRIVP